MSEGTPGDGIPRNGNRGGATGQLGLFEALLSDGRPPLRWTGLALIFAGAFALFQSATGHFLPHDIDFLGDSAETLRSIAEGRLVMFMFHDRVAFGGSLMAVGFLYLWLVDFPLREGSSWAWWTLFTSGIVGFGSFLAYLGYGYLDNWHGIATLALLPVYGAGIWRSRSCLERALPRDGLPPRGSRIRWRSTAGLGRLLLLATGAGMVAGGATILIFGTTTVFVPQDLEYMGVTPQDLDRANPRLIPLIAHDRAGFGGGICTCGLLVLACVWFGTPQRSLWQVLSLAGLCGFGTAIGVHYPIGYTSFVHLAPAYLGFLLYLAGMTFSILGTHSAPERVGSWSRGA